MKRKQARKQVPQNKREIPNEVDVFMMKDRFRTNPRITRAHLKDILALPIKKDGDKGLFEHLLTHNKKNNN
jgi:hypothetical protein|tara:strand:+ start:4237 stop:4449 length:213 start_codon:yes stop_codon:yes gene_type:complete